MADITVKVGSVTNAQKGKRILVKNGFHAKVKRAAILRKGDGCGYTIVFRGDKEKALHLLEQAGSRIISVHPYGIP